MLKKTYTEQELKQAWGKLMLGWDWQQTICVEVKTPDVPVLCDAIEYFTGTEAMVYSVPNGNSKIMANGYRHGPWAGKTPERSPV